VLQRGAGDRRSLAAWFARALGSSIAVGWSLQHEAGEDVDPPAAALAKQLDTGLTSGPGG